MGRSTGACLFDWRADQHLLEGRASDDARPGGEAGGGAEGRVAFRAVRAPHSAAHARAFLSPWAGLIEAAEQRDEHTAEAVAQGTDKDNGCCLQ